jgi:hypothetical protein
MSGPKLEQILDECLRAIRSGQATVEECLARNPEARLELQPLLQLAGRFDVAAGVVPSAAVTSRTRARLYAFTRSHPRRPRSFAFPVWRLAGALAALVLAFATSASALAQSALPDDALYRWKLLTERAWSALSSDAVGTEILFADRRVDEFLAVSPDAARQVIALQGYEESLLRLKYGSTPEDAARIHDMLARHRLLLQSADAAPPLLLPDLDSSPIDDVMPTLLPGIDLDPGLDLPEVPDLLP